MNAKEKIIKAKIGLWLTDPFFATLPSKLKLVEDNTCLAAWTDGVNIGYNPKFIEVNAHKWNDTSLKLYKKFGFEIIGETDRGLIKLRKEL